MRRLKSFSKLLLELKLGKSVLSEIKKIRNGDSPSTEIAERMGSELLTEHRKAQNLYTQLRTEKEQGSPQ